jgi:hypothetical protein
MPADDVRVPPPPPQEQEQEQEQASVQPAATYSGFKVRVFLYPLPHPPNRHLQGRC